MLDVNPQTVCHLIDLAHEFHAKEGVVLPEDASNDVAMEALSDHRGDPTFREFKSAVQDLEPDQQVALVTLMWVGRGDFDAAEWDAAYAQAGDSWTEHTAEYLIATPLVADYLAEGLSQLGYSCEE